MKIQAIRIQNLASLDGHTEINFSEEPLRSAGIFAITGPTGAGKSTVLDALCLALYARTPRYRLAENGVDITDVQGSTIKQDDVRGILRDGTSSGYAEVDFVGVDGQFYRANWSVRRARNKADGNLQAYEMSLKNITSHQDIPGRKMELLSEIERLVGLNFEQFTRSVLLAQGDFTAFLKAGKDEKSSLLEKLTGTHIYSEISKKVFEHHREEQQKLRELNVKREGISTLTAEELSALQEQKHALKLAAGTYEKQITELNNELSWHEQWSKLQESEQSAKTQYDQATAAKEEAKGREQKFQQINRIQSARPIISGLQDAQKQIATKSELTEELSSNLISLKEQKRISDAAFNQAADVLNTKVQEEEQAQPLLNSAKALDVQLTEKAEQITLAKDDLATVCQKEAGLKEQSSQVENELKAVEKEIVKLSEWKTENESRQAIAEQENLILSKLQDAGGILVDLQKYTSRIQTVDDNISKQQDEKQKFEEQHSTIQTSLKQKQSEHKILDTALSGISIQDLENEKSSLDASIEDLIKGAVHWRLLFQARNEENALQQSLEKNQKELEQLRTQFTEVEKLLEATISERTASARMLEKAKLVAAESVERLRNQLVPEEPCPVCGSTHHPYASHHPELDLVLSELEAEYAQIDKTYTQQQNLHTSLKQRCGELGRVIGELEEKISHSHDSLKELEKEWSNFQISEKCNKHPIEERANWLRNQLQEQQNQRQHLKEQLHSYGEKKEQLEALTMQLTVLEKQFTQVDNQVKDTERNIRTLLEQQKNDAAEQKSIGEKLDEIAQALSVYFPSEQWFENWKSNPEAFETRIRKFTNEWKSNTVQLEEHIRNQSILVEKGNGIKEQLKHSIEEVEKIEQKLSKLQNQNKELSEQRMALFNSAPVEEVELKLKEAIGLAKQVLEEERIRVEKIQGDITRISAQSEQLEKDLGKLSKQESELNEQLTAWIVTHNQKYEVALSEEELLSLLAFTQDWIETERSNLRVIDDSVMQSKSILEERNKALKAHAERRPSARTLEELTILLAETKELFKKYSEEFSEIGFKLKEDVQNKERLGTLFQDIEKQADIVENWAKLNEIIGSADGKKFRQIAQEYTLDVLLSYANVHLEMLSKRYVLQRIPNSLGLQVIDQDMGDEVRTVYSLSGGESFLVSLALALGLASLSSSRMKVESLFIDEGFGSLDPTTLNIAMDALERLHNQGRKVGVISHVQEMTERIPVQIKVSKQQSGRSKVEVVGY